MSHLPILKIPQKKFKVKRLRTRSVLILIEEDILIKHSRVFMEKQINLNMAITDNDSILSMLETSGPLSDVWTHNLLTPCFSCKRNRIIVV